jgi:aspartate/methionine/tyrosine aminotransferase
MRDLKALNNAALDRYKDDLRGRYETFKERKLSLDMTRGKPAPQQLDLAMGMLDEKVCRQYAAAGGTDYRNYGGLEGIGEARTLFAEYLGVEPEEIIIGNNASLKMMHDTVMGALVFGTVDSEMPWGRLPRVKFLCPSPGYDRHFAICEYLNIEMIAIDMDENGPDMDTVEKLVAEDESIKGIWCVPIYSNPTGVTYADDVVGRLAAMRTKAKDFRIFCDNAYAIHHLTDAPAQQKNMLTACKEAGHAERVLLFGSTSKISFAGSGIAMMAASRRNIDFILSKLKYQTIGPNKLNQLHHVLFFKNMDGMKKHMKKHTAILKPKFEAVLDVLETELGGRNIANWSKPQGGYFVSIDTLDYCAKAVVAMAAAAGVKLTPAGSTFPYGKDPRDRNIRIAPSFPAAEDVRTAMNLVAVCIQLVSIAKLRA